MYERYYKFSAKPFRLMPDPRFLYRSEGHTRALAYLQYGLQCGEGFVIVTGEVGTGKTTLMRTLMENLKLNSIIAAQITTTQVNSHDFLQLLASSLNIRSQNPSPNVPKAQLLYDIEAFLLARAKEKKRVLLVIDEAQNLPVESLEELRMLSNIQHGEKAILQCFLLGQGEFKNTIRSGALEQFQQRVMASYHLGALSREETKEYIHHRLGLVGWKGNPAIAEGAYQKIYEHTKGIPRKINTFCDRLFLYGSLEELHTFEEETVDYVIQERLKETGAPNSDAEQSTRSQTQAQDEEASNEPVRLHLADNAISDTERRLLSLEKRMSVLEGHIGADRERIAKYLLSELFPDINIAELLDPSHKKEQG